MFILKFMHCKVLLSYTKVTTYYPFAKTNQVKYIEIPQTTAANSRNSCKYKKQLSDYSSFTALIQEYEGFCAGQAKWVVGM